MASNRSTALRRSTAAFAALAMAESMVIAAPAPAEAKGCIKGAVVGGVAGHYAGHGVLGAVGGCVVGRRLARQQAERANNLRQPNSDGSIPGSYQASQPQGRFDTPATTTTDPNAGATYNGGAYQRRNP